MICKDCKFFTLDKTHPPYGTCERWNVGYGYKVETMPLNEVVVENDEGWGMAVGPEFGCVLWQSP